MLSKYISWSNCTVSIFGDCPSIAYSGNNASKKYLSKTDILENGD